MNEPISLYIHWPYCSRICPYCDFNVTRDRAQVETQSLLFRAILDDMRAQAAWLTGRGLAGRHLASVFFGGGTPSLMRPEWVAEIIDTARSLFPKHEGPFDNIEITLEANPTDTEIARYRDFHAAGINRLSLGVQSLDDEALKFLGRNHSADEAITGIETALSVFDRVSLDLIYALPFQDLRHWEAELKRAGGLGVEHISPYQLTIEPTTAFGRAVRRGRIVPINNERAEAFYFSTQDVLGELGFEAYEVSNHAQNHAARSQHNVAIWRGGDYMGVGPGAHGRLSFQNEMTNITMCDTLTSAHGRLMFQNEMNGKMIRHASTAISDLTAYIERVKATATGCDIEALSTLDSQEEGLMLGMRMTQGVDVTRFNQLDLLRRSVSLINDGFLALNNTILSATPKGRVVLDRILFELLT